MMIRSRTSSLTVPSPPALRVPANARTGRPDSGTDRRPTVFPAPKGSGGQRRLGQGTLVAGVTGPLDHPALVPVRRAYDQDGCLATLVAGEIDRDHGGRRRTEGLQARGEPLRVRDVRGLRVRHHGRQTLHGAWLGGTGD